MKKPTRSALWVLVAITIGLVGCGLLYGPLTVPSPHHCVNNPGICTGSQQCNPTTGFCVDQALDLTMGEAADLPAPDLAPVAETSFRPKLVLVQKGSFMMGSPTSESGRGTDEVQHMVTLTKDFWMAESEVTQKQYRNLMGASPSGFMGDDLPVEKVSWLEAVDYCNALSVKEGLTPCYQVSGTTVGWADGLACTGYRLPTEAEWEYAASPATGARTVYAGSDLPDGVAWYSGNAGTTTHAVKTKTANGRGLYDLSGNVSEWVWDWYQSSYETLPSTDPIGPNTGTYRVIRGGAWYVTAAGSRVAGRDNSTPSFRVSYLGFRIVRSTP